MIKKLKLTKLTVANLDHINGGKPVVLCYCDALITNGVYNRDNKTKATVCVPYCGSIVYCDLQDYETLECM